MRLLDLLVRQFLLNLICLNCTRMKKIIILFILNFLAISAFAYTLNIKDLKAKGDGKTDNTRIIQSAIDKCSVQKGTVIIPAGTYLVQPLFLKSNVQLHLEQGAVLIGTTDLGAYHKASEGTKQAPALIYAEDAENITISGEGTINGQGEHANFQLGDDSKGGPQRPRLVHFVNCRNVTVKDITLRNSAYWVQDYRKCDGVYITGIKVFSQCNWNNDGLNIDSRNVVVSDCYIDSGDDALCFKSHSAEVCENITVTNCVLRSNCNAIKFGTATLGGFRNISVTNCVIYKASEDLLRHWRTNIPWMGLTDDISVIAGIALESVDGGIMEQISISNIVMSDVQTPIFIRLGDRRRTLTNQVSVLKDIKIDNIIARSSSKLACSITGIPDNSVENVTISNVQITTPGGGTGEDMAKDVPDNIKAYPENRMFGVVLPASGFYVKYAQNVLFDNVRINTSSPDKRPAFYLSDTKNVRFVNCAENNKMVSVEDTGLDHFPEGYKPEEIGNFLSKRFIPSKHMFHKKNGRDGIHYAEVCTWYGALKFAESTNNRELIKQLKDRFELLFTTEKEHQPYMNHVDLNMFGCLPLEFYQITGDKRYLDLGLPYADTQWQVPADATSEEKEWDSKGFSWQTRLWIDDMYMITIIQSQAYRVTGKKEYIERAAREMVMYLDELQRPNGLFYHAPDVPFYWARGNGWMAAGMSELLRYLPEDNKDRPRILEGYHLMMKSLKEYQMPSGMWNQLIDEPTCWAETSGTAMFAYAMITGVKSGWLDKEYIPVARKAWMALIPYINAEGDVTEVCVGTNKKNDLQYYYDRPRRAGDFHGQAPVLWCAHALME